MATIGASYLSLADKFKRENNLKVARIIEMLAESNAILEDAIAVECNNGTKHRTTMRSALPAVSWRVLNAGVVESKSTTTQVEDTTGILESWSRVDAKLVDLSNDPGAFRLSESRAFIEAMNQEAAAGLFYHDTNAEPEKILGFLPRFDSASAENGGQIIDGGGSNDLNTSVWFIGWGEQTCHLIYPQGTAAGLNHEDLGLDTVLDANNNPYRAYRDRYTWDLGLSVRDWRAVARVSNIDVNDLSVDASTGVNLLEAMVDAYWKLQHHGMANVRNVIYCNTTVLQFLDHQSRNANSNTQLTWRETGPDSRPVLHFRDMPIRRVDAIRDNEDNLGA